MYSSGVTAARPASTSASAASTCVCRGCAKSSAFRPKKAASSAACSVKATCSTRTSAEHVLLADRQAGEVRETARVLNTMARQLRDQFRTRGLIVAVISHDLRTLLTRLRMRFETMDADVVQQQRSVGDLREMKALIG